MSRISIVALAASAGACLAQGPEHEVLERMLAHYEKLPGCTVTVSLDMRSEDPMLKAILPSMAQTTPGWAVKPNRFAFWSEKKAEGGFSVPVPAVYCDGEEMIAAVDSLSVYSVEPAPESFGALIAAGAAGEDAAWQMNPGAPFVFALMSADPRGSIGELIDQVEYKGLEGEGTGQHHVFTTIQTDDGEEMKVELHVAATGDPWLVALKPDLSTAGGPSGIEAVVSFTGWAATAEAPGQGAIVPDAGWKKVDDVNQAIRASLGGGEEPAAAMDEPEGPGEGATAPGFSLPRLGSESGFALADHKGKVVVLDFWATWCPPCVKGLPTVSKVTGAYAGKGVVFAAVNLQEESDHVAKFMKQKGWSFDVALDEQGEVAGLYGVSGIPHSVVIDKKGVIRHVHVGFGSPAEYETRLRGELEALIKE